MNKNFTANPKLLFWLLVIILCAKVQLVESQNQPMARLSLPNSARSTQTSLQEVLNKLQQHYKVAFVYESDLISEKVVLNDVSFDENLDTTLRSLLEAFDLKYTKINEKSYAISLRHERTEKKNKKRQANAQSDEVKNLIQVSGTVLDETGEPIPGVNVIEKETTNGTSTDVSGRFTLNVAGEQSILVFSFIGYETLEKSVGKNTEFSINMANKAESLEEVVVIGYGTQKKANLTGSVGAVDAKEIEKLNVVQTSQLLTGQVSGLTVTQSSGQPGKDGVQIRLRGVGTFSPAGTSPLVLVDGLASSMDNVDPNDIASISVLKDAASASIYGTRAANGVILIETKKGKDGKVKINYHGFVGFQQPTEIPQIVDSWTYAEMMNEALTNNGSAPQYSPADIAKFKSGEDPDNFPNKNHYKDLLSTGSGIQTNHYISAMGGTDKSSYLISGGYQHQEGLIAETFFDRYNLRANLDNKLTDKLKLNLILSGRYSKSGEPTAVDKNPALGAEGMLDYAIKIPTTIPGKMSNGYYGNQTGFTVEGWLDSESFISNNTLNLYSNLALDYEITKSLKLTIKGGYDFSLNQYTLFRPTLIIDQFLTASPSDLTSTNTTNTLGTFQTFLNYDLNTGLHSFHMLAGFSQESFSSKGLSGFRDNFPNNALYQLDAGSQSNQQSYGTSDEWALRSFFGRVTYNYNEKYLLEVNARYDGSSRFAKGNRYGLFPSLSAGWRISEEDFFTSSWVDELKLRASWGKLGNQNIGNYPYQQVLSLGLNVPFGNNEVLAPGAAATVVPNFGINWEETRVADLGVDVSFYGGKLSLTADYYDKLTSGILYNVTASRVLGLTPSVQNAGIVSNKGFDFDIRYREKIGNVSITVAPNFSYVKNEVVELANVEKDIANGWFVGSSVQSIYGYISDGLFVDQEDINNHATQQRTPKPGTIKFRDISGPNGVPDGKVDADYDRTIIGNQFPKFNFGLNLGAKYKGLDFSVLFQGVAGVDKIIGGFQGNAFIQGSNPQQWMYEGRWTIDNPNPNAIYPRVAILGGQEEQFQNSTYILQNASYLRINNVQIGYNFPTEIAAKLRMSALRVYATGRNLLTFDSFQKGWDPESGAGYPPIRVFNFGVNLTF